MPSNRVLNKLNQSLIQSSSWKIPHNKNTGWKSSDDVPWESNRKEVEPCLKDVRLHNYNFFSSLSTHSLRREHNKIWRANGQGGGRQQPTLLSNASLIISLFVAHHPVFMLLFPTAFKDQLCCLLSEMMTSSTNMFVGRLTRYCEVRLTDRADALIFLHCVY